MQFAVAVVLARLLNPKDFGLIVLANLFLGISAAIADAGFEKTIIRHFQLLPVQIDTIFYINVALGVLLTSVLFLAAPVISWFFNEQKLTPMFRVISFVTIIGALCQVQRTLLIKELNFRKISIAQMVSSVGGGMSGIGAAFSGLGVWSLVISALTAQVLLLAVFWIKSDWYPSLRFSYGSIKGMLSFGLNILFSSMLFFFLQQFSNLIIGKFYSGKELGLANRGMKTPEMMTGVIQSVIVKIAYPFLTKSQENEELFRVFIKRLIQTIAFFAFPMLSLLFVNATDVTVLLFTNKWIESVIFLQIFCVVKIFDPFVSLYRELVVAKGYAKSLSLALIITSIVEMSLILLVTKSGIYYITAALAVSVLFQYIYYLVLLSRKLEVSVFEQLSWILPYLVTSLMAAVMCAALGFYLQYKQVPLIPALACKVAAGGCLYVLGLLAFRKIPKVAYFRVKNNALQSLIGKT